MPLKTQPVKLHSPIKPKNTRTYDLTARAAENQTQQDKRQRGPEWPPSLITQVIYDTPTSLANEGGPA